VKPTQCYPHLPKKACLLNPPPSSLVTPEGANCGGGRRTNQPVLCQASARLPRVLPNPSLKRTPNGVAHWAGRIRFAHFMRPAQCATPSVAA
jgi:hypothetical protein